MVYPQYFKDCMVPFNLFFYKMCFYSFFSLLEKKVTKLMAEKEDYKGWYFQPVHERQAMVARQGEQQAAMDSGTKK